MINKIAHLPSSRGWELKLKDWIKGLGIALLLFAAETLPELKEIVTGHDFGSYNEFVKVGFVIVGWFTQRYIKNNAAPPNSQQDLPSAP